MAELTLDDARESLRQNFAPWIHEMRLDFEEIGIGFVRLRMPFSDHLARSGGSVSGQALMAMADTAMVFAVASQLGAFQNMATVSQNTSFLRPIVGADVICAARVIKLGRRLVFGEATLTADGSDQPSAHATMTYALAPPAR